MKLYSSLSQKLEEFKPIDDKKVLMYVCGITPYDTTHLGHAFTYIFFDALVRFLRFKGYEVIYTQNVTDIDDDILKRALHVKEDWQKLGDFWTKKFQKDMEDLNVCAPTFYVKATDSIKTIIELNKKLIAGGFAYESNGNVYFEVKKFKEYGKLSRLNEKQMLLIASERGGNIHDPLKKEPLDFLLWQKSRPENDQPFAENEPSWKSPWGNGRPGWHIECSSMICQYLGDKIDIHGGGRDLVFPHHESEIAQSESYTGKKPFVKYWLHTAMLMYQGEKMSKSLGNLVMVSDLLKKYSANIIRFLLLSHCYRLPWEYYEDEIKSAQESINLIEKALSGDKTEKSEIANDSYLQEFIENLENDMDTPKALELMKNLANQILKENNSSQKNKLQKTLFSMFSILGFVI